MKKKQVYKILNNQEDEDGDNLNPGYLIINEYVENVLEIYSPHNTVIKRHCNDQLHSRRLVVSDRITEKK